MILSISHERAAQIKTVARFAGLCILTAIALIALSCYLVSALGLRYGRLARSRFEAWGGFARLYEVLALSNVQEGVGFWGAAAWAAEYSLTAAAIALVAVVHAAVLLYEAIAAQLARKEVLQLSAAVELQRDNGATFEQLCAQFGISKSTVKRSLRAA